MIYACACCVVCPEGAFLCCNLHVVTSKAMWILLRQTRAWESPGCNIALVRSSHLRLQPANLLSCCLERNIVASFTALQKKNEGRGWEAPKLSRCSGPTGGIACCLREHRALPVSDHHRFDFIISDWKKKIPSRNICKPISLLPKPFALWNGSFSYQKLAVHWPGFQEMKWGPPT